MFISEEAKPSLVAPCAAADTINSLETIAFKNLNNREIRNLVVAGDLMKSSLYLFYCDTITIVSEFPWNYEFDVPYGTDDIPGAFAVAKVLSYLGKKVTLLYIWQWIAKK